MTSPEIIFSLHVFEKTHFVGSNVSNNQALGGKHHQDKTNDVVDIYHKFSCSESITNRMILLVVYHNLAVSEPICYPKRETS